MSSIKKKTIIIAIVTIVIVMLTSVSFAWFVRGVMSDKFKFTVAYVKTDITVFRGEDYNKDGILDLDSFGEETYTTLGDTTRGTVLLNPDGSPLLDASGKVQYDNSPTKPKIKFDINNILPTQIYTWKLHVQNVGDVQGVITVDLNIPIDTPVGQSKLRVFSVTATNTSDKKSTKTFFDAPNARSTATMQVVTMVNGVVLNPYVPSTGAGGSTAQPDTFRDFELRVQFEKLGDLIEEIKRINAEHPNDPPLTMDEAEYARYIGRVYSNMSIDVRIEDNGKPK